LVNQERFFVAVLTALDECGIPYMVAGSVAAILYGEPRLTKAPARHRRNSESVGRANR
jgi:hypothetical protein